MALGFTYFLPTITGTHTNFPVVLREFDFPTVLINGGSNSFATGGGELKVYTDSTKATQLPIEVVEFTTGTTPSIEVWVKVPSASTGATLYLEKDTAQTSQPVVTDPFGRNAVWSDYAVVAHLRESPNNTSGGYVNSTGGSDGTGSSMAEANNTAKFGDNCAKFDGSVDYIDFPITPDIDNDTFVLQAWGKPDDLTEDQRLVSIYNTGSGGNAVAAIWMDADGSGDGWLAQTKESSTGTTHFIGADSDNNATLDWALLQYRYGVSASELFLNGSSIASGSGGGDFTGVTHVADFVRIGRIWSSTGSSAHFNGGIHTVKLRWGDLSDDWIATEYDNQNASSAWGTVGLVVDSDAGGTTIGVSGIYTTIADWSADIKALGTLQKDEVGILIDNVAYARGNDFTTLRFETVTKNGFNIILDAEESVRHNGSLTSGARIEESGTGLFYEFENLIVRNILFIHTGIGANASSIWKFESFFPTVENCIFYSPNGLDSANDRLADFSSQARVNNCLFVSGTTNGAVAGLRNSALGYIRNCTFIGGNYSTADIFSATDTGEITNCVFYGYGTASHNNGTGTFNGTYSNNASVDGLSLGNSVTLTGDPFVDSASNNYHPIRNGQLDNAGTDTGLTSDAVGEPIDERPPIGAFEDDSGIKDIGTTGSFSTIANWSAYVKGQGTLTRSEEGRLIDDAVYPRGSADALEFASVTLNGFTITLKGFGAGVHNGWFGSGARVIEAPSNTPVFTPVNNIILEDFSVENTTTGGFNNFALDGMSNCDARRMLARCASTVVNAAPFASSTGIGGGTRFESCVAVGGERNYSFNGNFTEFRNCLGIDAGEYGFHTSTSNWPNGTVIQNSAVWNAGIAGFESNTVFSALFSSNASEDNTAPATTDSSSNVTLSSNPFVDSASNNYRPIRNGLLDNAGTTTSVTTDAVGEPLDERPPIGAFEDDSGIKDIGTTGSFSTIANWGNYVKALTGGLSRNETGVLVTDQIYPSSRQSTNMSAVTRNGFEIKLTVDDAVRHNGWFGTGARIEQSGGIFFEAQDMTLEWLSIWNTALSGTFNFSANLYRCLVKDCIFRATSPDTINVNTAQSNIMIRSMAYGGDKAFSMNAGSTHNFYNCLALSANTGFSCSGSVNITSRFIGNASYNCTTDWAGTYSVTTGILDRNASEDGTHPGTNGVTITADPFEDSANDDYRITTTSQLYGAAVDEYYDFDDASAQGWNLNSTTNTSISTTGNNVEFAVTANNNEDAYISKTTASGYQEIYLGFDFQLSPDYAGQFANTTLRWVNFAESSFFDAQWRVFLKALGNGASWYITNSDDSLQTAINRDQDYHIEIRFLRDATNGGIEIWLDGVLIQQDLDQDTSGSNIAFPFLGNYVGSGNVLSGSEMFIDNISINSERIYSEHIGGALGASPAPAGTNYTITAESVSIAVNGQDATLAKDYRLDAESSTTNITGTDANLLYGNRLDAETGAISVNGQDVTLAKGYRLGAESAITSISGQDATLDRTYAVIAESGSINITGQDADLDRDYSQESQPGLYTVNGQDVTLRKDYKIIAETGNTSVNGQDASLRRGYNLNAEAGATTITGTDVGLRKGYSVSVIPQTISVTGQDIVLRNNSSIPAESGVFDINGQDAQTIVGYRLQSDSGTTNVTGQDANLVYAVGSTIIAESGAINITGTDATLAKDYKIIAETGSILISGQDADTDKDFNIIIESGTIAINGQDAGLTKNYNIVAESGLISITGQDVDTDIDYTMTAESGNISVTGQDANLLITRAGITLIAESGSITITGTDALLGERTGDRLLRYSSLSSPNSALQHFLNINYGSGGGLLEIIETDKITATVTEDIITAQVEEDIITAEVTEDVITATVIEDELDASVSEDNLTGSIGE